jgi:hypothetical protein
MIVGVTRLVSWHYVRFVFIDNGRSRLTPNGQHQPPAQDGPRQTGMHIGWLLRPKWPRFAGRLHALVRWPATV